MSFGPSRPDAQRHDGRKAYRPRVVAELDAVVLGDRGDDDPFPEPPLETVRSRIPVFSMSTSATADPAGISSARLASMPGDTGALIAGHGVDLLVDAESSRALTVSWLTE